MLQEILRVLDEISRELPVIFPIHPRTAQRIAQLGFQPGENFQFWEPQSYLQFLALQQKATVVITDSGGIQEETTFLGVPCLTVRDTTERPVTVEVGTNILVGRDLKRLRAEVCSLVRGRRKQGKIPPLWDGMAAQRIAGIICEPG
jgi:UDP-N-acetylglucosamine 2-epimerase (non-hydrolysing)